jgi:hypothetical protein
VTGKDGVVGVDENRVRKAEALDRRSDLPNLLLGVGACVALPGMELGGRLPFDL